MKTNDILKQSAETYRRKNEDYGESWKLIGVILYLMSHGEPVTLRTPQDYIEFGLFTRRLDKFCRSFHGTFHGGFEGMNFEDASDSDEDESVYAAMQAEAKHDREFEGELHEVVNTALNFLQTQGGAESEAVADGGEKEVKPNYGKRDGHRKGRSHKR